MDQGYERRHLLCLDLLGWREEEEKKGRKRDLDSIFCLGRLASFLEILGRRDIRWLWTFYIRLNDHQFSSSSVRKYELEEM